MMQCNPSDLANRWLAKRAHELNKAGIVVTRKTSEEGVSLDFESALYLGNISLLRTGMLDFQLAHTPTGDMLVNIVAECFTIDDIEKEFAACIERLMRLTCSQNVYASDVGRWKYTTIYRTADRGDVVFEVYSASPHQAVEDAELEINKHLPEPLIGTRHRIRIESIWVDDSLSTDTNGITG